MGDIEPQGQQWEIAAVRRQATRPRGAGAGVGGGSGGGGGGGGGGQPLK